MGRGGREKDRTATMRKCIVTGDEKSTDHMVRFVLGPDDTIVPDVMAKLPGRGLWVSAKRDALQTAVDKNLFTRAARKKVRVADDLVELVEQALVRRVTDRIAMARKAGRAVAGYEKVKGWLANDEAMLLLQASDGSERGKSKLKQPGGRGSYFEVLSASELGLAFGREHVIHAALAKGGLAERVREDAIRLSGVRENDGGDAAGKVKKTI